MLHKKSRNNSSKPRREKKESHTYLKDLNRQVYIIGHKISHGIMHFTDKVTATIVTFSIIRAMEEARSPGYLVDASGGIAKARVSMGGTQGIKIFLPKGPFSIYISTFAIM